MNAILTMEMDLQGIISLTIEIWPNIFLMSYWRVLDNIETSITSIQ